jgi:hypothetical protein
MRLDPKPYTAVPLGARQGSKHLVMKPGDKISLDGMNVQIVSSAGKMITAPLLGAGQPNPACDITPLRIEDEEDGQSVGMVILFGRFRYAFLGDLTWNKSRELFCPNNLLGRVDVVPEQYIANLNAVNDEGHWIKLGAEQDGAFSVTNSRNGFTKKYPPSN